MHLKQRKSENDKEFFYGDYETKRDLTQAVDKQIEDYRKKYPNARIKAFHNELGVHVYAFNTKSSGGKNI